MSRRSFLHRPLRSFLPLVARWKERRRQPDEGFTLIELLITIVIVPIVMAGLTGGLIAIFSQQAALTTRVGDSGDAQTVSANYEEDVQSASEVTTDASASQCGTGTQLFGLEWNQSNGVYQTVVSYSEVKQGSVYLLQRAYCDAGAATRPTSLTTIAFNIEQSLPSPTISPNTMNTAAALGWVAADSVTQVNWSVVEPETGQNYTIELTASPADNAPPSTGGSPIVANTTTTCGFAATEGGTQFDGTYADTLCFVDFSSYNATEAAYPECQTFVASIPGGDTLSFCMSESGNQPMVASPLPTYPEAFLGNTLTNADNQTDPFYTGLGCSSSTPPETSSGGPTPSCIDPAMYQTDTGYGPTNTLTFTNITVTTATGAPATGWEWVSADAETTDTGEYITWTSNQDLYLLANSPSSPYGDTCNDLPNYNGPQGLGTTTVTCESGSEETSATKTGTPMVEAAQPTSMTITMKGAGLEGIAVGLLLS